MDSGPVQQDPGLDSAGNPVPEASGAPDPLAQVAAKSKLTEHMERVRRQAVHAAARLLAARDPAMPRPKSPEEMIDLVEHLVRTRRRLGVTLSSRDMKCLREWNNYVRFRIRRDLAGQIQEEIKA